MTLTKEQYLSKYDDAVRNGTKSDRKPTWEHLPAGHMYWGQYEREQKPGPEEAATAFLSQTIWGRPTVKRIRCKLCRKLVSRADAHRHQRKWIGPECWDDRLHATE